MEHFSSPRGGFFDTSDDPEELVVRPKDVHDDATPVGECNGNECVGKLGAFTADAKYVDAAEAAVTPLKARLA